MRSLVLGALLGSGCVEPTPEPTLDTGEQACESANKLSANKLSANKLSVNKLSANALSTAAVASGGLATTEDGRELLGYLVSCALRSTQEITIDGYTFTGSVGLAWDWTTRALTEAERAWVSACLLARVNAFGVTVPLSLRGRNGALRLVTTERTDFTLLEGAFWGDVFDSTGHWYACTSGGPTHPLRVCTLDSGDGNTTACGFIYRGTCANACQRAVDDAAGFDCDGRPTITVFLTPP